LDCLINELISVLEQEIGLYEEILKVSKDKTSIIVEGKVNELEEIVKAEHALILRVSKVENQREILINKISKVINRNPDEINLTILIENTNEIHGAKLKEQQQMLGSYMKELGSVNELNSQLIKSSLEYINFSLNLFANAGSQDNNYGIEGEKSDVKARSMLDIKI
jgi:flagellar biosynthesis/type III secretory pathway chaperone